MERRAELRSYVEMAMENLSQGWSEVVTDHSDLLNFVGPAGSGEQDAKEIHGNCGCLDIWRGAMTGSTFLYGQ